MSNSSQRFLPTGEAIMRKRPCEVHEHLAWPDPRQVAKHMTTAKPKNSAAAFRSLEAEHADLCRDEHQTTKEAAARAEARIAKVEADIKDIANSVVLGFGERFIRLLRNRFRSSGLSFDYFFRARSSISAARGDIRRETEAGP